MRDRNEYSYRGEQSEGLALRGFGVQVVTAQAYLTDPAVHGGQHARACSIFCRSYRYQSLGYYVSLLAAARGPPPIPSVTDDQDLKSMAVIRAVSDDLDELIQQSLSSIQSGVFTLSIYFGGNMAKRHARLSLALFNLFQAPFLRAHFAHDREDGWQLRSIRPIAASEISDSHRPFVVQKASEYFSRRRFHVRRRTVPRYSLAILYDPAVKDRPSDRAAIQKFERAAEKLGMETEVITRDDFARLAEFDALFLRETTGVMHHTYRFARRAEAEGLVVIDDSLSILRCTNKVYLAELLDAARRVHPADDIVNTGQCLADHRGTRRARAC